MTYKLLMKQSVEDLGVMVSPLFAVALFLLAAFLCKPL